MAAKSALFSDDSDIEENDLAAKGELRINKNYANNYDSFRRKEELQRLKDAKYDLGTFDNYFRSGNSSDDSDEEVKPTIQSLDLMANTLLALKDKSARATLLKKIKSQNGSTCENGHSISAYNSERKKKKKKEAIYTMDTHRRETNWNTGDGEDISEDENEPNFPEKRRGPGLSLQHCTVDQLLADKKKGSGDKNPQNGSEEDFHSATQSSTGDVKDRLKQALLKPDMTPEQKWLANYLIKQNQQMLDECSDSEEEPLCHGYRRPQPSKEEGDMHGFVYEDEADETRRTMRETLASFGGDGPTLEQQRPKSYPAVLESTVRVKDDKRRQRRLKDAERKAAEKQRLRQEVQQLQAIKRKEIQDRLKKIQQISGQTRLAFSEEDLDDEFDPEAHDRKMQEAFGENYYDDGTDADLKKPVFEYDEAIDADIGDFDEYQVHGGEGEDGGEAEAPSSSKHANTDPDEDDYPEEHDAEAPQQEEAGSSSRRRRGKRRKNDLLCQALQRKKPLFDPEHHDFDKYYDEYYALNFEDVIAGGEIKCRFKYKQVEPNNFGLTTEEILAADDKELNKWCGLKKLLKNDRTAEQEERDRKVYAAKGKNIAYKKKMLPTLFKPPEEEIDTETVIDVAAAQRAEEERKKKKNLKKKLRKQRKLEEEEMKQVEENSDDGSDEDTTSSKSVTSKNKKRIREAVDDDDQERMDDHEEHLVNGEEENDDEEEEKPVHSSTTVPKAKKSKADELHKFNKKMKKRRCEEEARLQSEAAAVKEKSSQRKARKDLVVGDAFSTVLKLSDERLAAYNITGLSKLKNQARYQEKMAERGLTPAHHHHNKKSKKDRERQDRDKASKKHKDKSEMKDKSKKNKKSVERNEEVVKSKDKKEKSKHKTES